MPLENKKETKSQQKPYMLRKSSSQGVFSLFLGQNMTEGRIEQYTKDLSDNNTKIPENTTSITFLGHSGNYLIQSGRNVSGTSEEQLAKDIASKYQGNKELLTNFYLLSCEAGLTDNEGASFAKKFQTEMQKQGFKNVKVHAFTAPKLTSPATDMIVETSVIREEFYVSSWCYKNKNDSDKDFKIKTKLEDIDKELDKINVSQNDKREELKKQKRELEQEQIGLRIYTCYTTPYVEALNYPQNTVDSNVVMNENVANIITKLITARNKLLSSVFITNNKQEYQNLSSAISALQKNANTDKVDAILKKLWPWPWSIPKNIDDLVKGTTENNTNPSETTTQQHSKPEYIKKLFSTILDFVNRHFFQIPELKETLSNKLNALKDEIKNYDNQIQQEEALQKSLIKALSSHNTYEHDIKTLKNQHENNGQNKLFFRKQDKNYKDMSTDEKIKLFENINKKINNNTNTNTNTTKDASEHIQNQMNIKTSSAEIEKKYQDIKQYLIAQITSYLNKTSEATHKEKRAVMRAMLNYLNNHNKDNKKALDNSIKDNKGWDAGLRSRVNLMKMKLDNLIDIKPDKTKGDTITNKNKM